MLRPRALLHLLLLAGTPVTTLLAQRVAVVTGATRGIGKGIAVELGRAGYAVFALGRSSRGGTPADGRASGRALPQGVELTVEATAEAVDAVGGRGVGVVCDAGDEVAMAQALESIFAREGRLDVVVCSAYTTPPGTDTGGLRADFWTHGGMAMWDAVNGVGLRGVYATCAAAAPLMISTAKAEAEAGQRRESPPPLMVLVSSFGGKSYTFNVAYGVGKAAIDRLALDMSLQLKEHGVATTSLYPGLVRTEANLEMLAQGLWDKASGGLDLSAGETPAFSGKAVAALARLGAEAMLARSGRVEVVAELATEFGFAEEDGSRPASIRSLKYLAPNFIFPEIEREGTAVPRWVRENVPDLLLPWSVFAGGPPPGDRASNEK